VVGPIEESQRHLMVFLLIPPVNFKNQEIEITFDEYIKLILSKQLRSSAAALKNCPLIRPQGGASKKR
jgi:hypothetical protein